MSNEKSVNRMSEEGAKEFLIELLDKLDELNEDDFFGTEGWRHYMGFDG